MGHHHPNQHSQLSVNLDFFQHWRRFDSFIVYRRKKNENAEISVYRFVLFRMFEERFFFVVVVITWAHEDHPKCDDCARKHTHKRNTEQIYHLSFYKLFITLWFQLICPPNGFIEPLLLDHDYTCWRRSNELKENRASTRTTTTTEMNSSSIYI